MWNRDFFLFIYAHISTAVLLNRRRSVVRGEYYFLKVFLKITVSVVTYPCTNLSQFVLVTMVLTKWPYHLHYYLFKTDVFPWTTVILKGYRFTGCALVHVVILGNQFMWWPYKLHYSDVLMSGMASPFFKGLLRRRSKKASKLCGTGLWKGNPPGISLTKVQPFAGGWPSQRASIAENVSIWLVFVTGISRMVEKWNIHICMFPHKSSTREG